MGGRRPRVATEEKDETDDGVADGDIVGPLGPPRHIQEVGFSPHPDAAVRDGEAEEGKRGHPCETDQETGSVEDEHNHPQTGSDGCGSHHDRAAGPVGVPPPETAADSGRQAGGEDEKGQEISGRRCFPC